MSDTIAIPQLCTFSKVFQNKQANIYGFSIPENFWSVVWFIGMVNKLAKVSGVSTINAAEKNVISGSVFLFFKSYTLNTNLQEKT